MLQLVASAPQRRTRKAIAMIDDQSPPPPLPEFSEREVPTKPGNPKPGSDTYDTSFLQDDSTFSQAVKIVASAANDINREREERRKYELEERKSKIEIQEQQKQILWAVQQADRNNTANYNLLAEQLRLLKQSDVTQDSKIAQLEKIPYTMEERIADLKHEILTALPEILQREFKPYLDRIELLEKEARENPSAS